MLDTTALPQTMSATQKQTNKKKQCMMGKNPTQPQKVNEKSVWCIFTDDGLVGVNYSGASDRDVTHAGEVVAVQARPGQARKETPLSSVPNFLTPTRTHIKKTGCCDRSANGAVDPDDPSWKNIFFFFFYIRVVKS